MTVRNRKRVITALMVIVVLVVIVPTILYISAIDHSKSYSASVDALVTYDGTQKNGVYKLNTNNLTFKTRINGLENNGDNVILLHGFPQTSSIWEPAMKVAKQDGYRLMAYDQRGYSPGARPKGKEYYDIDFLVEDLFAMADELGFETFHLVGHDWGASVGWKAVMDQPDRILSWTALSIPHTGVFIDAFQNHPEQQKRSSYISRLQKPLLPELLFVLNKEKMMKNVEGIWRDQEIEEIGALLGEHGALTAVLNWYRAADLLNENTDRFNKEISVPTLYIWGNQDQVVAPDIIPKQKKLINAFYKEVELDAGHSLIQEQRDTVISLMLDHWLDCAGPIE